MTTLHEETFQYLKPTPQQLETMNLARTAFTDFAVVLDELLIDGADKTFILRSLRTLAMWANVAITREADGTPRVEAEDASRPAA